MTTSDFTPVPSARTTALSRSSIASLAELSGWKTEDVDKANILVATEGYVRKISDAHVVKLEVVRFDVPKGTGKDTSSDDLYKEQNGKYAPTKHALEKLALVAGIRWDVEKCGPTHVSPDAVVYRAVGALRGFDGQLTYVEKVKEWNLDVELEEIHERAATLTVWDDDAEERGRRKPATDAEKAAYIRKETARAKKHRMAMVESKAKNRVIRALLNLPGSATLDYWRKTFVVPRIDILIDAGDPATKERLLDEAFGARKTLGYSPRQEAPAGVDPETGEVDDLDDGAIEGSAPAPATPNPLEEAAAEEADDLRAQLDADADAAEVAEAGGAVIGFGSRKGQTIAAVWADGGSEYVRMLPELEGKHETLAAAAKRWIAAQDAST